MVLEHHRGESQQGPFTSERDALSPDARTHGLLWVVGVAALVNLTSPS